MANNTIPTNSAQLIGLGNKMVVGMQAWSTPLGLTLITTAQMQANLAAFIARDTAFNAARSAQQAASGNYQAALGSVYEWLLSMRAMLVSRWGTGWRTEWAQAGFINSKTGIPRSNEARLGLALSLVNFLTANPTYQVPTMNLTAAYGTTLRNGALSAQAALTAATVSINDIGVLWQTAFDVLVKGMKDLIMNLTSLLSKDDPRWLAFGLQMPSTITTPGQPVNVTATTDGSGAIIVVCDAVPLATRYRWRTLLVGLQQDYVLAASMLEPLATLTGYTPGQPVQIIVQAVNGGLQGVASEAIVFTLPVANAPAATKAAPAAKEHANGNGKGNGHVLHSRTA